MHFLKPISILTFFIIFLSSCEKEPDASFNASKSSTSINDPVEFTNLTTGADHYRWIFGDGGASDEKNPVHSFSKVGDYTVTLYAFSKKGNHTNSYSQKISIGLSPNCNINYSPKFPKPGESVHFLDNNTNNPTSWLWDFGDGTTSTEQKPNHIYSSENIYHIKLTVSNEFNTYTQSDSVVVMSQTPVMPTSDFSFTYTNNSIIDFHDESTGNPTKWYWNFGDGSSSTLQNPSHQYSQGGYYYVTLRVFNLAGSHQKTQLVNLNAFLPQPYFIYSEGENYTINFQDISTGNPTSWNWDFGDGGTSSLQNPSHQYAAMGTYGVTFKVTNNAGTAQLYQFVHVSDYVYSFLPGTYNVIDAGVSGTPICYVDDISSSMKTIDTFYTHKFANLQNGLVYFIVNGTTIIVPSQTVHCGTPPNDIDHTFTGSGYFVEKGDLITIYINYSDSSSLGYFERTAKYIKH